MAGRLLSALLLILVLRSEQVSSSVLNNQDRFEGDTYTTADVLDDLAELNDLDMRERVQDSVPADVCKQIKAEFKAVKNKSMAEAKSEKPDSLLKQIKAEYAFCPTKNFQILQHGKSSEADDSKVLKALQDEACVICAIETFVRRGMFRTF